MRFRTQISAICRCNFEIRKIATSKSLITYPLHKYTCIYVYTKNNLARLVQAAHRPRFFVPFHAVWNGIPANFLMRSLHAFSIAILTAMRLADKRVGFAGTGGQLGRKHVFLPDEFVDPRTMYKRIDPVLLLPERRV